MTIYIPDGSERRLLSDLRAGLSMILVGERGSGLSTKVEYLLANCSGKVAIKVSARLLSGGALFLSDLAYECVRVRYGTQPPEEIEKLVVQLRTGFEHYILVELLDRLNQQAPPPLIVIDRFECLAVKLKAGTWASVRYVLEQRLIQFVLLSRLSIPEMEKLSDSKFGQTILESVLHPPLDSAVSRSVASIPFEGVAPPEASLDYITSLTGGHRLFTVFLASLLSRQVSAAEFTPNLVDQVIVLHRDAVRQCIESSFRSLHPEDDELSREYDIELQCALAVDHAPSFLMEPYSIPFLRLQRLGHLTEGNDRPIRFNSRLVRSDLRRRWLQLRHDRRLTAGFLDWVEYDDLLRRLIRSGDPSYLSLSYNAMSRISSSSLDDWEIDQTWWGSESGDFLDYLQADNLHVILRLLPNLFEESWFIKRKEDLDLVSLARKPISSVPWSLWPPKRRIAAFEALTRLRQDVVSRLGVSEPASVAASPIIVSPSQAARTLRWLHISDAHFHVDQPFGENIVIESLIRTLRQQRTVSAGRRLAPPPDLIFFTGDVAFSGKSAEYERAKNFFDQLLGLLELDRSRLFIIPGNHDVDRAATPYLDRNPGTPEVAHRVFKDARWRRLYAERLAAFNNFHCSYFGDVAGRQAITTNGFSAPQFKKIRNVGILVYPLNLQWCAGLPDDRGKLVLGASVLHEDVSNLPNLQEDSDLRVALIHQPLSHLVEFEQQNFLLLARNLDAVLRGHLHNSEVSQTVSSSGELVEFCSGALSDDPGRDQAAQFVEIDVDSREFLVFPIRYEPKRFRWGRDTSLGDSPDYVFKGSLVRRVSQYF